MAPKTIYIIRHAEGFHNLPPTPDCPVPVSLHDPILTPTGQSQCEKLRPIMANVPLDLIVTSPLRRTLQTTLGVFKGHPTLTSRGALVFQEVQECADLKCNIGNPKRTLLKEFSSDRTGGIQFDFTILPDDDNWIEKKGDYAATQEALTLRAAKVRRWLADREEERIAIVTHGAIMHFLIEDWSDHCLEAGTGFKNCEMRELLLSPRLDSDKMTEPTIPDHVAAAINGTDVLVETEASRHRRDEPVHRYFSGLDDTEKRELDMIEGKHAYLRRKTLFPRPKDIKIIFSDVDGTLITSKHNLHPLHKSAILHYRTKYPDIPIVVASGRHKKSCLSIREECGILDSYAIHCNGGILYQGSTVIASKTLSINAVESIVQTLSDRSLFAFTEDSIIYFNEETEKSQDWFAISSSYDHGIVDAHTKEDRDIFLRDVREGKIKILKITSCVDVALVESLTAKLNSAQGSTEYSVTRAIPFILEMMPKGVNKFWAVERVCKDLNIDPKYALAFGDGENDREMLSGVGYGVVMNNAMPVVKAVGRFITASNDEGGLGSFLYRIDK